MGKSLIVSVCVIALNEQENLPALLDCIRAQDYDHSLIEVVLVDSGSVDETKAQMLAFKENNDFRAVQVMDNLGKIQSSGLNEAIRAASGDIIVRVDAHALIPADFVSANVECIDSGEYVCGGHIQKIIKGDGLKEKILLMAETSMFGSGIAKYRWSNKKEYVKTLAHACYRREVFEKVGVFNEKLLRSEDNEFHYRIRKAGYKICLSDKIFSQYQTRATLKGMLKQKFGNGKWIGITSKISPKIFSLYHYIPFLFVLAAMACFAMFLAAFAPTVSNWLGLPFIAGVALYFLIDIFLSIKSCVDYKEARGFLPLLIMFPLLHFAYGIGTFIGFIMAPFKNLTAEVQL